jgi:hypothetical protein
MRDCKIATIWEGTNGIQAMDLLGRKLGMNKGKLFLAFIKEIRKCIDLAATRKGLESLAGTAEEALTRLEETAKHIGNMALFDKIKTAFAYAHPFLEVVGDVCIAWMHLWRASAALPRLEKLAGGLSPEVIGQMADKNKDVAFYDGQMKTAEYFILAMLPVTVGKMKSIQSANSSVVDMHAKSFGG